MPRKHRNVRVKNLSRGGQRAVGRKPRRALRKLLLASALMAATGGAPAAHADGARAARAQAIAAHVWGQPCPLGGVTVVRGEVAAGALAQAEFLVPPETPWPAAYSSCRVVIGPGRLTWEEVCTIVLHEYGHLVGAGHSANPRSVMYATFERIAPRCDSSTDSSSVPP